ncbi:hypothetical protein WKW77_19955 [Variovorax ureilyticus]|uniref:Uncharacterized protein n=1 Tax=Variovorax ureilyticus TaxID=1836198 RepID=A0ABU8VI77_9BURK
MAKEIIAPTYGAAIPKGTTPEAALPRIDFEAMFTAAGCDRLLLSGPNMKSAILLVGSLVGALDKRSRKLMGILLEELCKDPDEAEDIAGSASRLANLQLNKARRSWAK